MTPESESAQLASWLLSFCNETDYMKSWCQITATALRCLLHMGFFDLLFGKSILCFYEMTNNEWMDECKPDI